ncbi:TetR/AcrR family transcriptional regulator [Actinomadura barringtoniae]|uniref:TetR/AcrR family transcriptional regulator n=1 Tax=Actinomadura barringtoniae TaxID=1427535 RepID=A0A939P5U5_9ACTN|nr:TetR/AcrR family transcriptional regulator [Actinomadura barringtoniae]MBO2445545.1 TetR/AcrR family transcriptional regulator [Actinomadura barringtoniae]
MSYDAEATRQRIFDAATAEFAEHGLAGARIERIATAAKANKQAIYLYFGGKEKLFGSVVRAKMEEICHAVALDPTTFPESIGRLFDWYAEHPELLRLLLWEALETGDGPVVGEEERRAEYRQNISELAAAGAGDGSLQAAQDWMFTVLGLVSWNFAAPQLRRLILDEPDQKKALARRRAHVIEMARNLLPARPDQPAPPRHPWTHPDTPRRR